MCSFLLHFTLGLFGPCHGKSDSGSAGIAGYSCQGYCGPARSTSLNIQGAAVIAAADLCCQDCQRASGAENKSCSEVVCLCHHLMQGYTICNVNTDTLLRGTD